MSQINKLSYIYNPANQTKEELIGNFIVRKKEFQKIYKVIKDDCMKYQPQHFLIIANRGNGKTTLLLRIYYEIINNIELRKWLIPIIFNEEQYHINRLEKLWEELALSLEEVDDKFLGLYDQMEENLDEENHEEFCFELLKKTLNKYRKKVVVFIDNIGDMLEKFNKKENRRLREVLLTSNEFRIVGASSKIMESTYGYSEPFFEFFKEIHLNSLNKEETKELLLKIGENNNDESIKEIIKNEYGRIEALRRMTDGVPRTIILLYEIFVDNKNGNSFKDLEEILDRVTPLYKHRMDDLKSQQQVIVDALAKNWDAMETKELARKTRLESKIVSAQLNSLSKNKIVTKISTNNKNNLYQISERFFNIWYLMRTGRKRDKNRVMFLTRFIENWCDTSDELIKRAREHILLLKKGEVYEKHAFFFTEAIAGTAIPIDLQHELIQETKKCLTKKNSSLSKELTKSNIEVQSENVNNKEAEKYLLSAIEHGDNEVLGLLGVVYAAQEKYDKAEKYLLSAVEQGDVAANNILSWYYFRHKLKKEKALEYSKHFFEKEKDIYTAHTYCMILLWDDKIEKALDVAAEFLDNPQAYKDFNEDIGEFLILLIAKKQYHITKKLFQQSKFDLIDRYKPIYYALMSFLKDENPNEILKMGEEIKITVEEVIEKINRYSVEYR